MPLPTLPLRHAVRSLARRPGFSLLVILTLAVGIGANLGVFGYLTYMAWPTVDAPHPERIAWIHQPRRDDPDGWLPQEDWRRLAAADLPFAQHAAYAILSTSVQSAGRSFHAWGFAVGGAYFQLFAARPQLGRLLTPADDAPGAEPVVVLSDACWRSRFGADPGVIGRAVTLDGRHPYTVVGVTREGFQGHGFTLGLYLPLATAPPPAGAPQTRVLPLARLAGDDDPATADRRASQALAAFAAGLDAAERGLAGAGAGADDAAAPREPRRYDLRRLEAWNAWEGSDQVRRVRLLLAAVGLLLLLACANVAHLMLARAEARGRELGVRAALGAGRWRLGLGLAGEAALLAGAGAALGVVLGRGVLRLLESYLLASNPVGVGDWALGSHLVTNGSRLAPFLVAVILVTAVLCGLAPLARAWRTDPAVALRGATARAGRGGRPSLRSVLVVTQVALAVVLLLTGALLVRSLWATRAQDPGFETDDLLVAALYLPRPAADAAADGSGALNATYDDLLARARELPGVASATLVGRLPLTAFSRSVTASRPGGDGGSRVDYDVVGDGFATALGVPLLAGRDFGSEDAAEGEPTVLVNRAAARELWPAEMDVASGADADVLGRQLVLGEGAEAETFRVVGVVGDMRGRGLATAPAPTLYLDHHRRPQRRLSLLLRTASPGAEAAVATALRDLLARQHPEMAVIDLVPFSQQIRSTLTETRMVRDLGGGFGLLGAGLAALGIFSLLSYEVSRRVREIGVRQAVGADRGDVVRLVLGRCLRLVATGVALGLAAAWPAARLLASQLHGVGVHDPASYLAVPALLLALALIAAWLPAHRAASLQPLDALRHE